MTRPPPAAQREMWRPPPHTCDPPAPRHSPAMLRFGSVVFAALGLLAAGPRLTAAEPEPARHRRVEIAPTKTSIYVGSVSMTMPTFARREQGYESTYVAKVFPFFFSSESGRLRVEFTDEMLQRLERSEVVEFTGRAVNDAGAERRIEGKATPLDATGGKIKVRVFVSKKIELIFNTTYRFPDAAVAPHAPGLKK